MSTPTQSRFALERPAARLSELTEPANQAETSLSSLIREFSALSPDLASRRSYASGDHLIIQGSPAEAVHFVMAGIVKVWYVTQCGREVISGLRLAPCIIGAEAVILERPSLVTASALTGCQVRQLPARRVRDVLAQSASLSFEMSRSLARESRDHIIDAMEASSGTTRRRLINLLGKLHAGLTNAPSDPVATMLLKKHEIAKLLGVTPEHLSRLFRMMEAEGILRREAGRVVLQGTGLS